MKGSRFCIVPAAGCGRRMGGQVKKQFLKLDGCEILKLTLTVLSACDQVDGIIVLCGKDDLSQTVALVSDIRPRKIYAVLQGGQSREESVAIGLRALPQEAELVAVHDAVRPFVTGEMIRASFEAAERFGAALTAVPVKDTVKMADSSQAFVRSTLPRPLLYAAQSPQTFRVALLRDAFRAAEEAGLLATLTDDASAIEQFTDVPVRLIPGSDENIKITTPRDLALAELLLDRRNSHEQHRENL